MRGASLRVRESDACGSETLIQSRGRCHRRVRASQVVPFAATGLEHAPVLGLQAPAVWHWSLAVQVTGLLPVQVPFWQESVWVHALPSLQLVPLAATGFEQAPVVELQVPATWHWSLFVHVTGFEPAQTPA